LPKKRFSAISERTRTLVFTDLDGTLLDHHSYSWEGARPALEELRRRSIPLILCTSKTRAEVAGLRRAIGNTHPFVVENGGAIVIPSGYFDGLTGSTRNAKYNTLTLGQPYDKSVRDLRMLARQAGVKIRGFHQMTAAEVARTTGLSPNQARMARQRETAEPFVFQNASSAKIRTFCRLADEHGYSAHRGGRFWHFSAAGCDKGLALSVLIDLYRIAWGSQIRTIALGDSGNDLPMLQLVDRPILMPKPDGSFDAEVTAKIPRIARAKDQRAETWGAAVLHALDPRRKVAPSQRRKRIQEIKRGTRISAKRTPRRRYSEAPGLSETPKRVRI
jgi:mannosyl-3-phosphoglycerate phosphatase family protein